MPTYEVEWEFPEEYREKNSQKRQLEKLVPKEKKKGSVEEHRSLGGSIIIRLDNSAFVGLIYKLLVFS